MENSAFSQLYGYVTNTFHLCSVKFRKLLFLSYLGATSLSLGVFESSLRFRGVLLAGSGQLCYYANSQFLGHKGSAFAHLPGTAQPWAFLLLCEASHGTVDILLCAWGTTALTLGAHLWLLDSAVWSPCCPSSVCRLYELYR